MYVLEDLPKSFQCEAFKKLNLPLADISSATGLSIEEIDAISLN
jgi:hypothetical protein